MITALLFVVMILLVLVLLLLVAIIRRLQTHEAILGAGGSGRPSAGGVPSSIRPTHAMPEFTVQTTTGGTVTNTSLLAEANGRDDVHVAFFSTGCDHCAEVVRDLSHRLGETPALAERLLVVIFDDASNAKPFVAQLGDRARVTVRSGGDPLIRVFGVPNLPRVHTFQSNGALRMVTDDLDVLAPARA